jgi:hypothetical protein
MDYQARYYDPRLGRFVSADTVVPEPGNPQSLNRYSYVNNSPLRFNDPTGHSRPLPPCSICQVKIDTSNWSDLAKGLPVPLSFLTGFHADREQNLVTGPTEQEWMESSLTNMVTPIGMVSGPVQKGLSHVGKEAIQEITQESAEWVVKEGAEAITKTGQRHHVFSNKIINALKRHQTLMGIFERDDVITRAIDDASHRGYETWHREIDSEVVDWLTEHPNTTKEEFTDFLQQVYSRPDIQKRFPDAVELLEQLK